MSLITIFDEASRLGLKLGLRGDRISVMPAGRVTPEFASELKNHRMELIEWFKSPGRGWRSVPPPDLPLNPNLPVSDSKTARLIMAYIVRQIGSDISKGSLCEWCLKREYAYWEQFHWSDQTCAMASARDAAVWQLQRDEYEIAILLDGCKEAVNH